MIGLVLGRSSGLVSGLTVRALRRGLLGGHPGWRLALVVAGLVRLLRFLAAGRPAVLREEIRPGESLMVRHLANPAGIDVGGGRSRGGE